MEYFKYTKFKYVLKSVSFTKMSIHLSILLILAILVIINIGESFRLKRLYIVLIINCLAN